MIEVSCGILLLAGGFLCMAAALGVVRLPDVLTRMHAATKAGSLGTGLLAVAHALYYRDPGISLRAFAIIALILLTAPVAAHLIGRAAYRSGEPLSDRTWLDERKKNPDL